MCDHSLDLTIKRILADELVQLTMTSDGVTETEMQRLLEQAHRAIIGRKHERRIGRNAALRQGQDIRSTG